MNPSAASTRRSVLVGAGAAIGVAVTAACSDATDDPVPVTSPPGLDPSAGASAETSPDVSAGASEGADGGATPLNPLVKVADLEVGGPPVAAKSPDGKDIVIARPATDQVVAFSAVCTHQGCAVVPEGKGLNCPCHSSKFNAYTGAVLNGPASKPLPAFAVRIEGDSVVPGA